MATALSGAELEVLSDAGELEASWAARPIELIDRRGQQPPGMEDPGGQALATLLGQTVQHVGAERGLLIVRRADEARVEAEATAQPNTIVVRRLDELPGPSDLPDTVLRYVRRTQEAVMLDDASVRNQFSNDPYVIGHRVRALVCLPLVKQGTLIGALYLENRAASHVFTPPRVGLLKLLASQAAVCLENAHLYTELRHAQTYLEQRTRELAAANEELRRTVDAIPHAITILDPEGGILGANAFVLDYMGLSLEEVSADVSRLRRLHPDDVARLEEERRQAFLRGEPFETEERARRKDGQYRWFLIRYNPVRDDDGHIIRWYATGTDIDDRKRAEDRVRSENLALREEVDRSSMFEEIVGTSPPLRTVLSQVSKVAPTDSTVLITGETGTGKELIARAIHKRSPRSARAFVAVNCAAIPSSLIASELFGHEKGAFTGALHRRQGRFELADGGTIFLDEVGELPAETQIMLLRVLQEREFERVGGSGPIRVNVRVIAATNRDLRAAVADGTFRADLFYRLNVFPLDVPALRERRPDILLLVEYFIHRYAKRVGKQIRCVSKETSQLLQSYDWPGNIRELQNVIERAVIVCDSDTLSIDARWLSGRSPGTAPVASLSTGTLATHEKDAIEAALMDSKGRVSGPFGAAGRLGVPASTLESKIKALNIDKRRFKSG
jgi:formate hydrogenlyase transcriptional activator